MNTTGKAYRLVMIVLATILFLFLLGKRDNKLVVYMVTASVTICLLRYVWDYFKKDRAG